MEQKKQKKSSRSNLLLILIFVVGLSLLLYPSVADWWNSFHSTRAISAYDESVAQITAAEFDAYRREAQEWNAYLAEHYGTVCDLQPEDVPRYESTLAVSGTGVMGYVEIPTAGIKLPMYHSVDEPVLQIAAGHIPSSSLPVGGETTHCLLSGHRGLPSARLFTDLDRVVEGDLIRLHVLDQTLTYEVYQILTVLPQELEALQIRPGEDLLTLVTCTPYGVNSHRLLVQARRVEVDDTDARLVTEARRIEPITVMPFVAAPLLIALLLWLLLGSGKQKKRKPRGESK